ncbi:MAG: NAD(P)H-hydrate dehydratase [Bifidobacteriaceae bacterium]|nr:NAD(P)H-hydrate dehydratase [Bifidobacteriaceae bacterium]
MVGLITGSNQYPGAAVLGVGGAARTGAGYVRYVGPRRCEDLVLACRPETVMGAGSANAWVIGSGMADISESDPRYDAIEALLSGDPEKSGFLSRGGSDDPAYRIVDAGALLEFARIAQKDSSDRSRFVVTPHSGELAKVLAQSGYSKISHSDVDASDDSRLMWAQRARDILGCTVVLKGARTVIVPAGSTQEPLVVAAPTHWLATAGTGDVLAGIMGTVVAQLSSQIDGGAVSLAEAAALSVVLHGYAAGLASATTGSDEDPQDAMSVMLTSHVPGQPIVAGDIVRTLPVVIGALLAMRKASSAAASIGFRSASEAAGAQTAQ